VFPVRYDLGTYIPRRRHFTLTILCMQFGPPHIAFACFGMPTVVIHLNLEAHCKAFLEMPALSCLVYKESTTANSKV
jgi:hypothetical protein